jgi:hypothetical protein
VEVARRSARKDMARFSPEEAVHHVRASVIRERRGGASERRGG